MAKMIDRFSEILVHLKLIASFIWSNKTRFLGLNIDLSQTESLSMEKYRKIPILRDLPAGWMANRGLKYVHWKEDGRFSRKKYLVNLYIAYESKVRIMSM